jgi:hypothetical protein
VAFLRAPTPSCQILPAWHWTITCLIYNHLWMALTHSPGYCYGVLCKTRHKNHVPQQMTDYNIGLTQGPESRSLLCRDQQGILPVDSQFECIWAVREVQECRDDSAEAMEQGPQNVGKCRGTQSLSRCPCMATLLSRHSCWWLVGSPSNFDRFQEQPATLKIQYILSPSSHI